MSNWHDKGHILPNLLAVFSSLVALCSLYGRFQQSVGQVLRAALRGVSSELAFGEFKSSGIQYKKVPDVVGLSATV